MKSIPFIRKLKHIQKQYQRDLAAIIPNASQEPALINLLFSLRKMGLDMKYNPPMWGILTTLSTILTRNGGYEKQKRFSKLCRRLGSAAKKQGKLVYIEDIWTFACLGKYKLDYVTGKYSEDARVIPFHLVKNPYTVTMRFIEEIQRTIWAESEEQVKEEVYNSSYKHKKEFKVEVRCQKSVD